MKKLWKSNQSKFSGYIAWLGIIGGGLYSWFYKDAYDLFTYMVVGFLVAAAILAIFESIFID